MPCAHLGCALRVPCCVRYAMQAPFTVHEAVYRHPALPLARHIDWARPADLFPPLQWTASKGEVGRPARVRRSSDAHSLLAGTCNTAKRVNSSVAEIALPVS